MLLIMHINAVIHVNVMIAYLQLTELQLRKALRNETWSPLKGRSAHLENWLKWKQRLSF